MVLPFSPHFFCLPIQAVAGPVFTAWGEICVPGEQIASTSFRPCSPKPKPMREVDWSVDTECLGQEKGDLLIYSFPRTAITKF